jgi:hypothetical protein
MGDDDKKPVQPPSPHRDRLLELVIIAINETNNSTDGMTVQGITLAVNGLLISGKIISERDFILSNGVLNTLDEITEELAREAAGFGDVERSPHEFFASSAESVGEFGFGKGAEIVIENKLEYFEGAMSIAAG